MVRNLVYRETVRPSAAAQTLRDEFHMDLSGVLPAQPSQLPAEPKQQPTVSTTATATDAGDSFDPLSFAKPFMTFMTDNPTVYHAVSAFAERLEKNGFEPLTERKEWKLKAGGKYYVERNGSALIAFAIGKDYKAGNGFAVSAAHVDSLAVRLKPVSKLHNTAGFVQLGVAPYAGGLNSTWWDRDLGLGGRVLVKDATTGKVETKLLHLDYPIARIPTLAPHFGAVANGPFNLETNMVPIIGIDNSDLGSSQTEQTFDSNSILSSQATTFASTQSPGVVKIVTKELGITSDSIVNWDLELFDTQPAQLGGLNKDFIFAGRIDDKICSWAAMEGLILSSDSKSADASSSDGIVKMAGVFDDEEIGSLLRQGARGNFLPTVIERVTETFADGKAGPGLFGQTYANSFLVSADVTHAVNPNFLNVYLANHAPRLNVGVSVAADPNGHMTTDAVSTAILQRCAEKSGSTLQVFQIRNDSRSGGTVGPMLSAKTGMRAIDAGIPQLSMHSIRATVGSLDPGLGVKLFKGFFDYFEVVDQDFE